MMVCFELVPLREELSAAVPTHSCHISEQSEIHFPRQGITRRKRTVPGGALSAETPVLLGDSYVDVLIRGVPSAREACTRSRERDRISAGRLPSPRQTRFQIHGK
jgi:hypothetical protein